MSLPASLLQTLLLGCDEGLYVLDLSSPSRPPMRVPGCGGVYQMELLEGTSTVAIITGERTGNTSCVRVCVLVYFAWVCFRAHVFEFRFRCARTPAPVWCVCVCACCTKGYQLLPSEM